MAGADATGSGLLRVPRAEKRDQDANKPMERDLGTLALYHPPIIVFASEAIA